MGKQSKSRSATQTMTDRAMTGVFSRAFAQPLKLLGQTEASLSSYAVFWAVAFNEGSTQVEIGRLTGLSAKTVSRVISQLGDTPGGRGWIRQAFDSSDRRVRRLHLTAEGKQVRRRLVKDMQDFSAGLEASA
jgi:DNA-binding MarR family transcriptional regulator